MSDIPVLFDHFHHQVNDSGEDLKEALAASSKTWKKNDGIPMIDYSSQELNEKPGKHVESIDIQDFNDFIENSKPYDFDIMLEIKDKEKSALKAVNIVKDDVRFYSPKIK
jgi:UV DNA damage endonuclease